MTDVDLVVLESATGAVFLCQLKHQELYGADIHAMEVRTSRLREEIRRWLQALDGWVAAVGEAGMRSAFRLLKTFPTLHVYRLVISRHYGYPLKNLARTADTTYASWVQFFNCVELVRRREAAERTLNNLFAVIKKSEAPGGPRYHAEEPRSVWMIGDLKFTVSQDSDSKSVV